jgi:hypothetical protein
VEPDFMDNLTTRSFKNISHSDNLKTMSSTNSVVFFDVASTIFGGAAMYYSSFQSVLKWIFENPRLFGLLWGVVWYACVFWCLHMFVRVYFLGENGFVVFFRKHFHALRSISVTT